MMLPLDLGWAIVHAARVDVELHRPFRRFVEVHGQVLPEESEVSSPMDLPLASGTLPLPVSYVQAVVPLDVLEVALLADGHAYPAADVSVDHAHRQSAVGRQTIAYVRHIARLGTIARETVHFDAPVVFQQFRS